MCATIRSRARRGWRDFWRRTALRCIAGQVILTGTYAGLLPVEPGEHWRTTIGDLAAAEINIR